MHRPGTRFLPLLTLSLACGSTTSGGAPDASPGLDAQPDHKTTPDAHAPDAHPTDAHHATDVTDASGPCHATLGAADRVRRIVVSHPFNNAQTANNDFEVFDIDTTGAITQPHVHFKLGPTTDGKIAFTPDGAVGIVAEDDGTLGVFTLDSAGVPHVVTASMKGSYYATSVVMDPSGLRAYVMDDQTANNGGGIYTVDIACDGTLTDKGLLASAELPATVIPVGGGHAVVAAVSFLNVPPVPEAGTFSFDAGTEEAGASEAGTVDATVADAGVSDAATPGDASADAQSDAAAVDSGGNNAVLVPWPSATSVLSTANPFGDDLAIVSSAALTQDGLYVLLGDNSGFSGVPNRVGIVGVSANGISAAGVVQNVNDPESIIASPFDNTILVTSAFGNALFVLTPSTEAGAVPFTFAPPITYAGPAPQLPGPADMILRGTLTGRVIIAENQAIRQAQFGKTGGVTDLGGTSTGDPNDFTDLVGAIGVQP